MLEIFWKMVLFFVLIMLCLILKYVLSLNDISNVVMIVDLLMRLVRNINVLIE